MAGQFVIGVMCRHEPARSEITARSASQGFFETPLLAQRADQASCLPFSPGRDYFFFSMSALEVAPVEERSPSESLTPVLRAPALRLNLVSEPGM